MYPDLGSSLTGAAIGAAIAVHRELGPGLDEPVYERALSAQLLASGISHSCQFPLPLLYKGVKLDCGYRIDVVIENRLVLELKSVENVLPVHQAQLLTYLRLTGIQLGLLMNFDVALLKDGIYRRALSNTLTPFSESQKSFEFESFDELTHQVLQAAFEVHRSLGPGLLCSAYENALCFELSQRRFTFQRNKPVSIVFHDIQFENAATLPLVVEGKIPVVCLCVDTPNPIERVRLLWRMRQGNWRTGLIINFNVSFLPEGVDRVVNGDRC